MKQKIMSLILALILLVSFSVTALADNVVTDGNVTIITDENGNTITVEEVDENEDEGGISLATPTPAATTAPAPAVEPAATAAPAATPAPASGGTAPAQNTKTTAAPDASAQPDDDAQAEETAPASAKPTAAPSDKPDAVGASAEKSSGGVYAAMAALVVFILACVAYLIRNRKK